MCEHDFYIFVPSDLVKATSNPGSLQKEKKPLTALIDMHHCTGGVSSLLLSVTF